MNLSILGAHLVDPGQNIDAITDIHIAGDKILALGEAPADFQADEVFTADGLIACPGLIDLGVYLREPGQEFKATICSESRAAAKSGITTLICMPDTYPRIDTPAVWELIRQQAQQCGSARVLAIAALTQGLAGEQLSPMGELQQAGCVAVSNGRYPVKNNLILRRALEYASTFELPIIVCSEDADLKNHGCAHEGEVANRLGLPGIPVAAETVAVARDLALAQDIGYPIHFHTLSSGASLRLLAQSEQPLSISIAAHHFFLTEQDIDDFNPLCHVDPPLRSSADRDALRQALKEGLIQIICSDHQPHEADAKMNPFPLTASGISALETLLPLSLRLVQEEVISLSQAIACLSLNPARLLNLPLGTLKPGYSADLCLFDPQAIWRLEAEQMLSMGKHSPFIGWEFYGQVKHTLFQGQWVYHHE